MHAVLVTALESMQVDAARLQRVATNLASATVPGYKREVGVQRAGAAPATDFADLVDAARDLRDGTLRSTGQPLDLAISGGGFFEVATPTGPAYTRLGQFQLDARGRIVNAQGHALMGQGGEIVVGALPAIDARGSVIENGKTVDRIRVVELADAATAPRVAGGIGSTAPTTPVRDDASTQIRQGFLENANVDPAREMVELISTMRHFESMQRIAQQHDEMVGGAIRRLSDA